MTSKLDHALSLAARGFRVFPLASNGKTPAIAGWPDKATTDEAAIRSWWNHRPNSNIGIATGGGLMVIDVDDKADKRGSETFAHLDMLHDIPPTYTVTTPSGGRHAYLRTDSDVRNSSEKLGRGIDVRGFHGFVVGPGSTIGDKAYAAEHDGADLGRAPESLVLAAGRAREETGDSDNPPPSIELDTPRAQERALQYLSTAEPAIEGAGGDHHTYQVICKVKDLGISEALAFDLIATIWNDTCSPPWQPDELQTKIHNAYRYGNKPVGVADPAMDFEPVAETAPKSRLHFELWNTVEYSPDTHPLIDEYLDKQAFSVIYGESHVGKTFVALDMAFHVAAGRPWNGRHVEKGGVVYIAAEGGKGIRKRVAAMKKWFAVADAPFALVPCSINLLGRGSDLKELVGLIDRAALDMGVPVSLIVVDTLSRAMAGANENASEDMTAFVEAVDKIRAASGAHVMVVHHAGKDTAKGARGHSSLRAATDTELEVADGALAVRKQRDGEHVAAISFGLKTVELGADRRGKPVSSCVVRWASPGDEFSGAAVTTDEQNFLMAVRSAQEAAGEAGEGGVAMDGVMAAYRDLGFGLTERSVRRGLVSLESKGAVRRNGSSRWVKWAVSDVAFCP